MNKPRQRAGSNKQRGRASEGAGRKAGKTYDGVVWNGGNGVTYGGLAGGDTAAAVLSGTLTYGGTSQGATGIGIYAITPGGLSRPSVGPADG